MVFHLLITPNSRPGSLLRWLSSFSDQHLGLVEFHRLGVLQTEDMHHLLEIFIK